MVKTDEDNYSDYVEEDIAFWVPVVLVFVMGFTYTYVNFGLENVIRVRIGFCLVFSMLEVMCMIPFMCFNRDTEISVWRQFLGIQRERIRKYSGGRNYFRKEYALWKTVLLSTILSMTPLFFVSVILVGSIVYFT